ncbi:hypothetical protein B0T24DRAFT_531126 [Lasiosphaeria ovina]|uniref:Uncharacterized protein n=1 Tax=Lasiosphaeria ovina TaxID=92902 RepID=A0AAE0K866_9PEZI|nr:hypothetical protein B0T24DRAFT_531126 [Lasiosphaeria ovina]
MTDQLRSKIIDENPIGKGLHAFLASFNSICKGAHISCTPDALEQLGHDDLQNLAIDLLLALQSLRASRLLRSSGSGKNLFSDLSRLNSAVNSDDFDLDSIKPLLRSVIAGDSDALIWKEVYNAVTEPTPPPQPIASSLQQTPWLHNTSSFANSSEYRKDVDRVLRDELGVMYVGHPIFAFAIPTYRIRLYFGTIVVALIPTIGMRFSTSIDVGCANCAAGLLSC